MVDGEIFGFEIPFIGDQLADAATFILDLREEIRAVINSATTYTEVQLEGLLYNALGPSGLDFILPINGSVLPNGLESVSQSDVNAALTALVATAGTSENIMPHILNSVRKYATLGEISAALQGVFGNYRPG